MEDETKIAERIKFWEEQKKINEALIPRVLELQDILKSQNKTIKEYSDSLVKVEERLHQRLNKKIDNNNEVLLTITNQRKDVEKIIKENKSSIDKIYEDFQKVKNDVKDLKVLFNNNISKINQDFNNEISQLKVVSKKNLLLFSKILGGSMLLILVLIILIITGSL